MLLYKFQNYLIVLKFIKEHPFALICGTDDHNSPVATQVPVFIDEKEGKLFLSGHIMRNTDHHKAFLKNDAVLLVFTGPHAYISASWYTDKKQASTWNYQSVHIKGTIRFTDQQALIDILKRTTNHFENNVDSGANYEDIPEEYVAKLVNAIVAFEVAVESIDHVFKLSQNRDEKSYDSIIAHLMQQGYKDRKSTRLNSSHSTLSRMPSSA